ncbi:helix-hairpin-helix domain-containing protein [Virgibacillus sp. MSJ-26]|uniref:ComEA family DNA-binding protein n=1 Tax=Virgibacillus sp. MSJ-26 TaxID=2841522 RepID=UPI001C128553|nr:helix-hairpin-helix domain-containing protein [Virgibacillus sp. MSJ-26]MBU5468595.1 helix-hairpin-helix domain-containing protein [Virgibacillus sp. MSJ-26]
MSKSITPLGRKWEMANSIWMIWLFVPFGFTFFISFLHIGVRARQLKWLIAGFIYFGIVMNVFIIADTKLSDTLYEDISYGLLFFSWSIGIAHAFLVRRKYLVIRAERIRQHSLKFRGPGQNEFVQPAATISRDDLSSIKLKEKTVDSRPELERPKVVNVNKATKEELAAIPSISNIIAAEIIRKRQEIGKFHSFRQFIGEMNMKPHVLARAKPYLIFSDEEGENDQMKEMNRNRKKSNYKAGRIVDY